MKNLEIVEVDKYQYRINFQPVNRIYLILMMKHGIGNEIEVLSGEKRYYPILYDEKYTELFIGENEI
jgi:hypothetical protein